MDGFCHAICASVILVSHPKRITGWRPAATRSSSLRLVESRARRAPHSSPGAPPRFVPVPGPGELCARQTAGFTHYLLTGPPHSGLAQLRKCGEPRECVSRHLRCAGSSGTHGSASTARKLVQHNSALPRHAEVSEIEPQPWQTTGSMGRSVAVAAADVGERKIRRRTGQRFWHARRHSVSHARCTSPGSACRLAACRERKRRPAVRSEGA